MSRLNPKFKLFSEDGGSVIFPCPGQIWNLNIFCESLGLVIFLYPDQIWNLKFSMRVGGQSSFHVQTKAEISIFQQRLDGWSSYHTQAKSEIWNFSMGEGSVTFPCPGQIWNLKFLVGVDHLSMSRPNLKFKTVWWGSGQSSFYVKAQSEI